MLLQSASKIRCIHRLTLLITQRGLKRESRRVLKEITKQNKTRDNEWIAGVVSNNRKDFTRLGDVQSSALYNITPKLQGLLEDLHFNHSKKIRLAVPFKFKQYKITNDIQESDHFISVFNSFEDKISKSINSTLKPSMVTLKDLLIPTADTLPSLLYSLYMPTTIHESFFNHNKLQTLEERAEYLYETAFHNEYFQLSSRRSQPQKLKVDMSNPSEWYPKARMIKRKLILHVGPTNSGKTYNALQRLKESNNGYFAGPLRLLAREIYDRFKSEGIRCNLVTGEEIIRDVDEFGNNAKLSSGTIEMIDINTYFDVVILDEIQMIGDVYRGWAWTHALLGVRAKEVHLCGEASTVSLIRELAKMTGDEVILNEYQRLGELIPEKKPVTSLNKLKKGDCIVVFSKKKILTYKTEIEKETKFKCGVVYGALPAETRTSEAAKFNNGEYDILIASDAIGMGLNLRINRVIFDSNKKFNGEALELIPAPHVKQIAGRAGRFKVPSLENKHVNKEERAKDVSVGYVTARDNQSLQYIKNCLNQPTVMLKKAYIWPNDEIWSHYMSEFPAESTFSKIITAFEKEVDKTALFSISSSQDRISMVSLLEKIEKLLMTDQLKISTAPINSRTENFVNVINEFGTMIATSNSKMVLDLESLNFDPIVNKSGEEKAILGELEVLHKYILVWLWMNNRYPTIFVDRESAVDVKNLIEDRIEEILDSLNTQKKQRRKVIQTKSYTASKPKKRKFTKKLV